ncbi:MAG: hypothetical protein KF708_22190 [Pirellulales bacterium]|nr:hypothetical protein [Pirellulales bacterium]
MMPKLSAEIVEALHKQPGQALRVSDDQDREFFLIVPESAIPTLWDEFLRQEIQKGQAAIAQGDVAEWDIEATIAEAVRRAALRKQ